MLSYLAFIHHGIPSARNPFTDGKTLAQSCVKQLDGLNDAEQFPPRLLILLASTAYLNSLKSEQLLSGVFQVFDEAGHHDVQLMGCSVAAVFFDEHIYRQGALLVCLASRLLEAKVRVSPNVGNDPKTAVTSLLGRLDLLTKDGRPVQSFANRTLFALFPGFGRNRYLAPLLHEELRSQLEGRVSIFGGVASANDPQRIRTGILFANRRVHRNKVVAASVDCGTPFGISLTQGLTDTDRTYSVAKIDTGDRRIVTRFQEGTPAKVWKELRTHSPVPLFANLELDRDPIVDLPTLEGESIRLAREVHEDELFRLMIPEPERMQRAFRDGVKQSLRKAWLLNPIGGLGFRCAGLLRNSKQIGLRLEHDTALIEHDLSLRESPFEKPFVGGFVDGEASVDENGKSVLGNWSNATLAFGDELRFRTPVYRGFEKLAAYAANKIPATHREGVDRLTQLVYDIGFPGSLLSLCLNDDGQDTIVAQSANGSRLKRILGAVRPYPIDGDDILAIVAREKRARAIVDTRTVRCGSMRAAYKEGIISQYIVPLIGSNGKVFALLQIALGDISYDTGLYPTETTVLDALGEIVNSGLNRTLKREKNRIIRKLDKAMNDCLRSDTIKQGLQQYLKLALDAFGLTKGHIRIAQEGRHCLSLVAGIGDYFEETRKIRPEIDFGDLSPTAQAFSHEKVIVINDAQNSSAHKEMCKRWKHEGALHRKLRQIGSYANIPFKSERNERGTINLVSSEPWFFTSCHDGAMSALSDRIGFLLETLRRKERELFLIGVSPQVSQIQDLENVGEVLEHEIHRFAEAAKAEIASLYLWDDDRDRFILRAQHGWAKPEWLNSAYYTDKERWTGATALGGPPRHIPDLFSYYQENPLSASRYGAAAFGRNLSSRFTVEAIGAQLRVAKTRLGVLTLYRRIRRGSESGFFTTDPKLLQRGADRLATLIAILQANRKERWRNDEHIRRQAVYDVTISGAGAGDFETRVSRQVLESYSASKALFYRVEFGDEETPRWELKKSFQRDPTTGQVVAAAVSPNEDELVRKAVHANSHSERQLLTDLVKLEDDQMDDPRLVALANFVKRACIPLVSEKKLVGVLDVHWSHDHEPVEPPDFRHSYRTLLILGEIVGSAYRRNQAKLSLRKGEEKVDLSGKAVQVTSAYVLQHQHDLGTIVQQMNGLLDTLKEAFTDHCNEQVKGNIIEELSLHCKESSEALNRIVDIGSRVVGQADENVSVKSLILSALKKTRGRCEGQLINVRTLKVPDHLRLYLDPSLIEIVFTNLINNAIDSMKDRKKRVLKISATANADGERITIAINDSGVGMTQVDLEQILRGFFASDGHISLGIPISRMILAIYGGALDFDSVLGHGTETRIVFPINYKE